MVICVGLITAATWGMGKTISLLKAGTGKFVMFGLQVIIVPVNSLPGRLIFVRQSEFAVGMLGGGP